MITIHIYGLDHFVVGQYSREHTPNIAQLLEPPEEEVSFLSSDSVLLHNGVEQISWNALVVVHAPHRYEAFEAVVAEYFLKTLSPFAIHVSVEFEYFHDHSHYESINPNYPRFIAASTSRSCERSSTALNGQALKHLPQEMHLAKSISATPCSFLRIALTGHASSQGTVVRTIAW